MKHLLRLRLVCYDHTEVPIEIEETATVKQLRQKFCQVKGGIKPTEFRILQRNMELHDEGTLQYYRVFDGTKLNVVKRLKVDLTPREHERERGNATAAASGQNPRGRPAINGASLPNNGEDRKNHVYGRVATGGGKATSHLNTARPDDIDGSRGAAMYDDFTSTMRPSTGIGSRPTTAKSRPLSAPPSRPGTAARPNSRLGYDGLDADDDPLTAVAKNVAALKRELRESLSTETNELDGKYSSYGASVYGSGTLGAGSRPGSATSAAALSATTGGAAADMWQRRVSTLEERLRQSEERNEVANQRIQELESTVRRYQLLMKKVSVTMGTSVM